MMITKPSSKSANTWLQTRPTTASKKPKANPPLTQPTKKVNSTFILQILDNAFPQTIPKGLQQSAQGCEERATLGTKRKKTFSLSSRSGRRGPGRGGFPWAKFVGRVSVN